MRIDATIGGVERISAAATLAPQQAAGVGASDFGRMLSEQIDLLSQIQNDAAQKQVEFAAGRISDVSEVVLAVQKADLALNFAVQLRNKVVEAYQEISRMQV
jgi:flagellar hook-basal body complex protein FliE